MKALLHFLRATITGGILFLLPIVLILMILKKAVGYLSAIVAPFSEWLPDDFIFGLDGHNLLAIVLLILLCFFAGLLFRSRLLQKAIASLEEHVLVYLPGYTLMKSVTVDALRADSPVFLKPVIVKEGDVHLLGFLVEEVAGDVCTVFIPEAPHFDSGDVRIVSASQVKKINVPINHVTKSLKNYGKGAAAWVAEK